MAKSWKAVERGIARELGGRRVPITGRARGSAPDVEHRWLSLEVKSRRVVPGWLIEAMAQAEASAVGTEKLPMAVIHKDHQDYQNSLCVIRLRDFMDWFCITFPFDALTSQPAASADIPTQEADLVAIPRTRIR